MKKAGKDRAHLFRQPRQAYAQEGGNSNGTYNCPKDRSHAEAHYFYYSWRLDCNVPGTWHWLLPALTLEAEMRSGRHTALSRKEAGDEMCTVQWIDGLREI